MKKTVKIIIAAVIVIGIIAGGIIIKNVSIQSAKVPDNPEDLTGNTAGNIYNKGLFAESDGLVYFANPYDDYSIYVMNSDQSNCHKFVSGHTSFINVAGDYVYYYTSTSGENTGLGYVMNGKGFFRTDKSGKHTFTMEKATTDSMFLVGNRIYYTCFEENPNKKDEALVSVKSVTTANKDLKTVVEDHIKLGEAKDGKVYYAGMTGDHHLYMYDPLTDAVTLVNSNINVYLPIFYQNKIYFLDLDDEYALKSYDLSTGEIITLTTERIDSYNLYNGMIFYQTVGNKDGGYYLKRMTADGSYSETIADGIFENINCTSTYTYFNEYGNPFPLYYVPTNGSGAKSAFTSAEAAVLEELKKSN